jgi:hypothetical protein
MNHYRIILILHWKDLTSSSVVVYRSYECVYNESIESKLLVDYETSIPLELQENLTYITVDTVNYLGKSDASQTTKFKSVYANVSNPTCGSSTSL